MIAKGDTLGTVPRSKSSAEVVDFGLKVEEGCNSARTKAKLKRRWPLAAAKVLVPPQALRTARKAKKTVALLCNVKRVDVTTSASDFPADFALRPNTSRIGALFKEKTRNVLAVVDELHGKVALRHYFAGRPVRVGAPGRGFDVPLSAFDLSVTPREGFEVAEKSGIFVAISKERDRGLLAEGLVRDLARRLQALRKEKGFNPTTMLQSASVAGLEAEDLQLLESKVKEIAFLVRVRRVELSGERDPAKQWSESDLDGRTIYLGVG